MIWNSERELESIYEHCLRKIRVIRNLPDDEKIQYIVLGIFIGIGLGYMIAMWVVSFELYG